MKCVIADTGPLVAILDRDEQHHAWAVHEVARPPKMLSCKGVLAEVHFLTQDLPEATASRAGWPMAGWNCLLSSATITP